MERHRCKLCFRKFSNGRALGGHMRSHMMHLAIPPKHDSVSYENENVSETATLSSSSTPFSTSEDEEILKDEVVEPTASSSLITLQDRESETESLKKTTINPTRKRRSHRMIKKVSSSLTSSDHPHYYYHTNDDDEADPPGSSVSDVTSDEDLAFCLMMLSRDKWTGTCTSTRSTIKRKFKCDTCNKSFKSYQALGGHRASHKKIRVNEFVRRNNHDLSNEDDEKEEESVAKKVHECPVCLRVFASGQALGGHKRSHVLVAAANGGDIGISSSPKKVISDVSLIDLNLPAPVDDEDDSAVSDVHF